MRFPFSRKQRPAFSRRRRFEQSRAPEANPYFQREPREGEGRYVSSRAFVGAGLVVVVLGLIYLFSYSRAFELTLHMDGVHRADAVYLEDQAHAVLQTRLWGIWKRDKYTTLSGTYFRTAFLENISGRIALDHIDVRKKFPDQLLVTVYEREPELTWTTHGTTYLLDAEGVIVQEAEGLPDGTVDATLAEKPHLEDANNFPVAIGEQAIVSETPQAVLRMNTTLKELGFTPTSYAIPEVSCDIFLSEEPTDVQSTETNTNTNSSEPPENLNANEDPLGMSNTNTTPECDKQALARSTRTVYAQTDRFQVRFAADNLDVQTAKLRRLLDERFFDGKQITYVDIRFGERVYYK